MSLHLAKGKPRTLAYGEFLRQDLKLLEVSEELLQELHEDGYVLMQFISLTTFQFPRNTFKFLMITLIDHFDQTPSFLHSGYVSRGAPTRKQYCAHPRKHSQSKL